MQSEANYRPNQNPVIYKSPNTGWKKYNIYV